jgi:hypothetical protein
MNSEALKPFDPVAHLNACFEKPSRRVAGGKSKVFAISNLCHSNADVLRANAEANGGYEELAVSQLIEELWADLPSSRHDFKLDILRTWNRIDQPLTAEEPARD